MARFSQQLTRSMNAKKARAAAVLTQINPSLQIVLQIKNVSLAQKSGAWGVRKIKIKPFTVAFRAQSSPYSAISKMYGKSKKQFDNRKAVGATSLLTGIGYVLGVTILLFVILPLGGRYLGLTVGGTAHAATSIDGGFARLIEKAEELGPGEAVPETLTVDKDFYLVSFNQGEQKNGEAISPPECFAASCLCVCVDDKCEKIDPEKNKGRDCRPFFQYKAIIAHENLKNQGNSGGIQTNNYVNLDGRSESKGYYFYVRGEKTLSLELTHIDMGGGNTNLYLGTP